MRRGKIVGSILLVTASLLLTACGATIPEMTEEESAQVVEYAAGLLLKYDQNYESKLVEEDSESEKGKPVKDKAKVSSGTGAEDVRVPQEEIEPIDMGEAELPEENRSVEEFYGIQGVEVRYMGFELKDKYPDNDTEELYFAMNAEKGYKFLILNFEMKNTTQQDLDIDMSSAGAKFKISVNGAQPKFALTTMLMNDLSTFAGTIEAGETERLVLVGEIAEEEASSIWSVALVMK